MSDFSLSEINDRISKESVFIDKLREEIASTVIGQTDLINRLLIGILANGHILIEGVPGLAKTLLVKTIAQLIEAKFQGVDLSSVRNISAEELQSAFIDSETVVPDYIYVKWTSEDTYECKMAS